VQHGHSAIDNLIALSTLMKYQGGGGVVPLRETKPAFREKLASFLSKATENPLMDWMYHSPEESFEKAFGEKIAFGIPSKEHHAKERGEPELVSREGLKELWKQAGSPRIKTHGQSYGYTSPAGYRWMYGKKTPSTLFKKMFGSDVVTIPEMGAADVAVSEFAHGLRFADPKKFSKYGTRKELILGKGQEKGEQGLYLTPGTEEYQTHSVVEPLLRDWLIKNYSY